MLWRINRRFTYFINWWGITFIGNIIFKYCWFSFFPYFIQVYDRSLTLLFIIYVWFIWLFEVLIIFYFFYLEIFIIWVIRSFFFLFFFIIIIIFHILWHYRLSWLMIWFHSSLRWNSFIIMHFFKTFITSNIFNLWSI